MIDRLFDLSGEVAVVTGAGRGIGEGIAKTLAGAGAALVCAARRKDEIERVAAEIRDAGGRAIALTFAYRDGIYARTRFRLWDRAGGRMRLEISRREGLFELPERALRVVFHSCPAPIAVTRDTLRLEERALAPGYTYEDGCVHVRLADQGKGVTLEVDPAP